VTDFFDFDGGSFVCHKGSFLRCWGTAIPRRK